MKTEHQIPDDHSGTGSAVTASIIGNAQTVEARNFFTARGSTRLWHWRRVIGFEAACAWHRLKLFARVAAKRTLDLVVVVPLLIAVSPLLMFTALTIFIVDGRPLMISQRRVGKGGSFFQMWKFRTMRKRAEMVESTKAQQHKIAGSGELFVNPQEASVVKLRRTLMQFSRGQKYPRDPRIMRCGRFIRKFSLDELPQFFQILRGDMSLVGPRPFVTYEVATYSPRDQLRHLVKPGLTGLWQISNREKLTMDEAIGLDLQYIARQSFWLDLKILALTVPAALGNRGGN